MNLIQINDNKIINLDNVTSISRFQGSGNIELASGLVVNITEPELDLLLLYLSSVGELIPIPTNRVDNKQPDPAVNEN